MTKQFEHKTVIITGASTGIGAATARRFGDEGAHLVLVARRVELLENVARQIGDPTRTLILPADVTDCNAAPLIFDHAQRRFGRVDVLANNAAATCIGPVETQDPEALSHLIDVNLKAPVMLTRLAIQYLRATGGGTIVNVASLAGRLPIPGIDVYSATKFGLRAFGFAIRVKS